MRSNDEREEFTRVKLKRQNSLSETKIQWNTVMMKGKLKQRGYKRDVLQSYKMRIRVIKNKMERYNLIVLNNMTMYGKFVIKWLLNIPPLLKCVATLPCEI